MESKGTGRTLDKYKAVMLLAAVGDSMGYRNGRWEFNKRGESIHKEMMQMTNGKGPLALTMNPDDWRYSDDTVMHIATALALVNTTKSTSTDDVARQIAAQYVKCWERMDGRAPGYGTQMSVMMLKEDGSNWKDIEFGTSSGGCGGAMRSACIGLFYDNIDKVVEVSLEAGRITHNNPIGYLGSVVSACFTFYAINGIEPERWAGLLFTEVFPKAQEHVKETKRSLEENFGKPWTYFVSAWKNYVSLRKLSMDPNKPKPPEFPFPYDVPEREKFYKQISYSGWGGASGHDSVIIAYDVILGCRQSWEEVCLRGILHGGDSDSTGTIAGAWFGALYGLKQVPSCHTDGLEGKNQLLELAEKLYEIATAAPK